MREEEVFGGGFCKVVFFLEVFPNNYSINLLFQLLIYFSCFFNYYYYY